MQKLERYMAKPHALSHEFFAFIYIYIYILIILSGDLYHPQTP